MNSIPKNIQRSISKCWAAQFKCSYTRLTRDTNLLSQERVCQQGGIKPRRLSFTGDYQGTTVLPRKIVKPIYSVILRVTQKMSVSSIHYFPDLLLILDVNVVQVTYVICSLGNVLDYFHRILQQFHVFATFSQVNVLRVFVILLYVSTSKIIGIKCVSWFMNFETN